MCRVGALWCAAARRDERQCQDARTQHDSGAEISEVIFLSFSPL